MKANVYETVTNNIIADLEKGNLPWNNNRWKAGSNAWPLRHNGQPYTGINVILLWMAAASKGYTSNTWMTYKQAQTYGGNVRKGEKSTTVVFSSFFTKEEDGVEKNIYYMKGYAVFNVDQIENLPEKFTNVEATVDEKPRMEEAEKFFENVPATVNHGGSRAFYSPSEDFIQMPNFESFTSSEAYYATRGHETVHWTSAKDRLDRSFGESRFGNESYAMEELVAEIGSAFLCANFGIENTMREDHAGYIQSWLKVLKNDKKAVFKAASYAQKAVDHLNEYQKMLVAA